MSRITVDELRRLMAEGERLLILDVRPLDARAAGGIIPGAVAAHATEIKAVLEVYPQGQETIVYCACPTEGSRRDRSKASVPCRVQEDTPAFWGELTPGCGPGICSNPMSPQA